MKAVLSGWRVGFPREKRGETKMKVEPQEEAEDFHGAQTNFLTGMDGGYLRESRGKIKS